MKKLLVATVLFVLFCIPALAQDVPQFEIFGGFSILHAGPDSFGVDPEDYGIPEEYLEDIADILGFDTGLNLRGFLVSGEGNMKHWLSIVGEFGYDTWGYSRYVSGFGASASASADIKTFTVMFGPRFSYRTERFRIFAHYLAGFVRSDIDASYSYEYSEYSDSDSFDISETAFGQAIGGGIDIAVKDFLSIRPGQVDLVSTHFDLGENISSWQNFFRYSGGVVFKFGSK